MVAPPLHVITILNFSEGGQRGFSSIKTVPGSILSSSELEFSCFPAMILFAVLPSKSTRPRKVYPGLACIFGDSHAQEAPKLSKCVVIDPQLCFRHLHDGVVAGDLAVQCPAAIPRFVGLYDHVMRL